MVAHIMLRSSHLTAMNPDRRLSPTLGTRSVNFVSPCWRAAANYDGGMGLGGLRRIPGMIHIGLGHQICPVQQPSEDRIAIW